MDIQFFPAPGEKLSRFAGDRIRFTLRTSEQVPQAFLRTNIGRASRLHAEMVQDYREELIRWKLPPFKGPQTRTPKGLAWRDVPMQWRDGEWQIDLTLTEAGYFQAKGYAIDHRGLQVWPAGPDIGISVDPNNHRTANTIYCAFTRMFGETRAARESASPLEEEITRLEKLGYAVIPSSGKLRDLTREVPHIFDTLGCRILQLLPINPTPTTYARFGRFGSPYACLDLMAVDPALVEFDRRTTAIDQFRELAYAVHEHGGRVMLDIVINHTGWGSRLHDDHPQWFLRREDGTFASPGAWGTVWEDLVELDHRMPLSWEYLAEVFIEWLRRGVDGFRCDAGYMVPTPAWRYIIAKVRHEFPNALFLLEGLGGSWDATEDLLTRGGMQWAYSELFQNFTPPAVNGYLKHSIHQSARVGTLVHYSETHDNLRLATKGRAWSLVRNQLCALTSHNAAYGFACGVEWLATEKIDVHESRALAWGSEENIVSELARLNRVLCDHPCFFDGAALRLLSPPDSPVLALERTSASGEDRVLVLVNLDEKHARSLALPEGTLRDGALAWDLLSQSRYSPRQVAGSTDFTLQPAQALCLAAQAEPVGISGNLYRTRRAQHTWITRVLSHSLEPEDFGPHSWIELAEWVEQNPRRFLGGIRYLTPALASRNLLSALASTSNGNRFPEVISWNTADRRRVTPIPPDHWLLIEDEVPFRATLSWGERREHEESVPMGDRHIAAFRPLDLFEQDRLGPARIHLERYRTRENDVTGQLVFLPRQPHFPRELPLPLRPHQVGLNAPVALLTNGTGGMARIGIDLGTVKSKYDCVLGANLHPSVPVDRHVFVKRVRLWANAGRFISPLNAANLQSFVPGPPACWEFAAIRGDGDTARIQVKADMLEGRNTTVFEFQLLDGHPTPPAEIQLTVRFGLEDRNFHSETHYNEGSDHHFRSHCRPLPDSPGFEFTPAADRALRVVASAGKYCPAPEWGRHLPHAVEQTRGQVGSGDSFSPGWFDLPLKYGTPVLVTVTTKQDEPPPELAEAFSHNRRLAREHGLMHAALPEEDSFGRQLALAAQAFVVRRGEQKTIIAGYPWFLDWGRDSLICARGLIAAGMHGEVQQLLIAFGRFEQNGTLPNTIHGEDASNRNTSDAPLWYGVVCEELAAATGAELYDLPVDRSGRRIRDVLRDIAVGYDKGTPNGIRCDHASGLVWSPSHFTWMDTNYPAGTPREGYPIEIQALWIRLLQQLERLGSPIHRQPWAEMAAQATEQLLARYWLEEKGWLADVLIAPSGGNARDAVPDDALRSNCLWPILFELLPKAEARRCLEAVTRHLVIPGALRSLAPLPLQQPLRIHDAHGTLLSDPHHPYRGRYEGDEDSSRKPAYHNGTAWTWTFPGFCEALARVWNFSPEAIAAARTYLGSMSPLLTEGAIGHLPEILDGDAPHQERGCDAQAWGVTEALRVWKLLHTIEPVSTTNNGLA